WAKAHGLEAVEGHWRGYQNLRNLALYALLEKKIPFVSAFVFSTENWNRTKDEVGYLMKLVTKAFTDYLDDFHKNNIRVVVMGQRDRLSKQVLAAVENAEAKTKDNTAGTLVACFNYGGHAEIVDAARQLVQSNVGADEIN